MVEAASPDATLRRYTADNKDGAAFPIMIKMPTFGDSTEGAHEIWHEIRNERSDYRK